MNFLRHLAPAAEFERDERERLYPGYVERGAIEAADAQADYQAWCAIVRWLKGKRIGYSIEIDAATWKRWSQVPGSGRAEPVEGPASDWHVMELAARKALRHVDGLRQKNSDDAAIAARRSSVDALLSALQRRREQMEGLTAELRAGAATGRDQKAA